MFKGYDSSTQSITWQVEPFHVVNNFPWNYKRLHGFPDFLLFSQSLWRLRRESIEILRAEWTEYVIIRHILDNFFWHTWGFRNYLVTRNSNVAMSTRWKYTNREYFLQGLLILKTYLANGYFIPFYINIVIKI